MCFFVYFFSSHEGQAAKDLHIEESVNCVRYMQRHDYKLNIFIYRERERKERQDFMLLLKANTSVTPVHKQEEEQP